MCLISGTCLIEGKKILCSMLANIMNHISENTDGFVLQLEENSLDAVCVLVANDVENIFGTVFSHGP